MSYDRVKWNRFDDVLKIFDIFCNLYTIIFRNKCQKRKMANNNNYIKRGHVIYVYKCRRFGMLSNGEQTRVDN